MRGPDVTLSTTPDKRVGARSKSSPPPTFDVDNQVVFFPLRWKTTRYFTTLITGGWGIRDAADVSQLLLAEIVGHSYNSNKMISLACGQQNHTFFLYTNGFHGFCFG